MYFTYFNNKKGFHPVDVILPHSALHAAAQHCALQHSTAHFSIAMHSAPTLCQVAGRTALHLAVDRQLEEMVRFLVKVSPHVMMEEMVKVSTSVSLSRSV